MLAKNLWLEPHRLFFFVGTLMGVSTGLHWYFIFAHEARFHLPLPAAQIHGFQMIYSTIPYFAFGALLTGIPRLTGGKEFNAVLTTVILALLAATELLTFFALRRPVLYPALFVTLLGTYALTLAAIGGRAVRAATGKKFALAVLASLTLGALGAGLGAWALKTASPELHNLSMEIGLYGFLLSLISIYIFLWPKTARETWAFYVSLYWIGVFFIVGLVGWIVPDISMHQKDWLHLFTIGGVSTWMIALMTRVTREQAALTLVPGRYAVAAIMLMQTAMAVRVTCGVIPELMPYRYWAAPFWTVALIVWAWGHFPLLLKKRSAV